MTGEDFWRKAAQWGASTRSKERGVCMFMFDERGMVQSEHHRAVCITWLDGVCRQRAIDQSGGTADIFTRAEVLLTELKEIDAMIAYLKTAPCAEPKQNVWISKPPRVPKLLLRSRFNPQTE